MKTDCVNEQVPDATTFLKFRHMIEKKREPEMHQTKKGNEWKFGMKCNVGVDAGSFNNSDICKHLIWTHPLGGGVSVSYFIAFSDILYFR